MINNHTYCGKIAYGKSKTVLKEGSDDEYHRVETDDYMVHEGRHEAIITEEMWEAAQAKKKAKSGRKEPIDKDHQYIYSALLKFLSGAPSVSLSSSSSLLNLNCKTIEITHNTNIAAK